MMHSNHNDNKQFVMIKLCQRRSQVIKWHRQYFSDYPRTNIIAGNAKLDQL